MTLTKKLLAGAGIGAGVFALSLSAAASQIYTADLAPLNDSGVTGNATLTYDNTANTLNVEIHAFGLQPGKPHPQHIHGALSNGQPVDSKSPTLATDQPSNGGNNDGYIELGEGATTYGPILIPLTSPPGGKVSNFPTAPFGIIDFSQTYDLANSSIYNNNYDESDVLPLPLREIVLHGMTTPVDINDNLLGQSYVAGEYDPVFPVASGEITALQQAVPGPGALGMLSFGFGMIGILVFARRRRRLMTAVV